MADGRLAADDLVLRPGDAGGPVPDHEPPRELALLEDGEAEAFLSRWSEVQTRFVDDPQAAVRDGDHLVTELLQALAARFAAHREGLESQWRAGSEPDTEQLRRALQSYRWCFQRLLST
jgi:hypothetical protein